MDPVRFPHPAILCRILAPAFRRGAAGSPAARPGVEHDHQYLCSIRAPPEAKGAVQGAVPPRTYIKYTVSLPEGNAVFGMLIY